MEDSSSSPSARLPLHLQAYWDDFYTEELENFKDHGELGDVWFGNQVSKQNVCYVCKHFQTDNEILDIGCGNGHFLLKLSKNKFHNLTGIDYSLPAIELAKSIADKKGAKINYRVANLLESEEEIICEKTYHLCHDKGTYDAITLSPDGNELKMKYAHAIKKLLVPRGFFIITSCNWTKEEIVNDFKEDFQLVDSIPTPQFQFGGKIGNTVMTLVFRVK